MTKSQITMTKKDNVAKIIAVGMLVFAIGFTLWLYRLEPTATIDPNDNAFQFALVDRTNQIWDYAQQSCSKEKGKRQTEKGVFGFMKFPFTFCLFQFTFLFDHWVPNWAEGYNLPYYYGHVPQVVIVASWRFINALSNFIRQPLALPQGVALRNSVSLFTYYHWVIYLLLSLFPLSVFLALRVIKLPWLAAGLGALLANHISTDGLYGLDPPSFLWRGYGLSSQLFAMIWMPLALAYSWRYLNSQIQLSVFRFQLSDIGRSVFSQSVTGKPKTDKRQTENRQLKTDNSFFPAVLFLTATAMGHLGLGMIALLSLLPIAVGSGVFATSGRISYLHLWKLVVLAGTVVFFLSYWIIPIFLADNYHNISFWDPPWKFNSYGAKETMIRLLNGDLFDWGRWPMMTTFVIIGLIAASYVLRPTSYVSFSLLFLFWLFMYFGRTTWGGLIDLIPGMKEFHLSRFIVGVHAAGLFLMPIGVGQILAMIRFPIIKIITIITIITVIGIPIYTQTISYSSHNDRLIKQANENHAKVKTDEEALFATIRALPSGRVFAGRGGSWGKDFRVAETPYYMHLSTYGIPTVLWLPQTWSPNSDVEQYFSEDQAKDYDLFGIRYVAAAPTQEAQTFWKRIKEAKTWTLYEVESSYFATGVRPAVVATDKRSYANVVRFWIQSDAHVKGLYPELTFNKDYPKTTGLPNFKMLDEVTYVVPDGSTHNLFAEPPWYQNTTPAKRDLAPRDNNPILQSETNDSDMVFKTKVEVGESCTECIVVLKQSFHPNWKATIDGKPAQTFTVFPFFLATLVPSGTHEIIFSYQPSGLKITLMVVELIFLSYLLVQTATRRSSNHLG